MKFKYNLHSNVRLKNNKQKNSNNNHVHTVSQALVDHNKRKTELTK